MTPWFWKNTIFPLENAQEIGFVRDEYVQIIHVFQESICPTYPRNEPITPAIKANT